MNSGDQLRCQCQNALVAALIVSTKAGPNQGRQFYTCPKVSAKCKFFQWMDETADLANRQSSSHVAPIHGKGSQYGEV
jgi:DNA topoisomerase-3